MVRHHPQIVQSSHSSFYSEHHGPPVGLASLPLLAVPSAGSPATFLPADSSAVSLHPAHGRASFVLSIDGEVETLQSASERSEDRAPRGLAPGPSPSLAHSVGGTGAVLSYCVEEHGGRRS